MPMIWHLYMNEYLAPAEALFDAMGFIPFFLDDEDDGSAIEQFDRKYCGGWDAQRGFSLIDGYALKFPGDPPMYPFGRLSFKGDSVLVYPHGYVCVVKPDRTFEVARLD